MYIWAKLHLFVLLLYADDNKIDNEYDQNDHYDNSNDNKIIIIILVTSS